MKTSDDSRAADDRRNPQFGNVGNRGDVLKHAALLALLRAVTRATPGDTLRYVDTHTFLLHAPLSSASAWYGDVRALADRQPAYEPYAEAQRAWSARGLYRCSAGLVSDACPEAALFLAEQDAATRGRLCAQLEEEERRAAVVLEDADAWPAHAPDVRPGPFLALVDPFGQPAPFGPALEAAAARLHADGTPGAILAFAYDARGNVAWPTPPPGFLALGRRTERPYHLAAWSTPDLLPTARRTLDALDWELD